MSAARETSQPQVHLVVTDEGLYLLQGKVLGFAELDSALQAIKEAQPDVDLHVVGSPRVTFEQVAPAMRLVQQHGLAKVGVAGSRPPDHNPAL